MAKNSKAFDFTSRTGASSKLFARNSSGSRVFLGDFEKPELYYLKIFARCRRSRRFEMSMLL
jgi:hypothetical protein